MSNGYEGVLHIPWTSRTISRLRVISGTRVVERWITPLHRCCWRILQLQLKRLKNRKIFPEYVIVGYPTAIFFGRWRWPHSLSRCARWLIVFLLLKAARCSVVTLKVIRWHLLLGKINTYTLLSPHLILLLTSFDVIISLHKNLLYSGVWPCYRLMEKYVHPHFSHTCSYQHIGINWLNFKLFS